MTAATPGPFFTTHRLHPMTYPNALEERLTNLEIKASFAEDLIDKLDQILIAQQDQIDRLTREVLHLRQAALEQSTSAPVGLRDNLPPHY